MREGDPFAEDKKASVIGTTRANDSKPKGDRRVFAHFPTYPNCEVCRMAQTSRFKCKNKPLNRADEIPLLSTFGKFGTTDHNILNLDDESRNDDGNVLIVPDGYLCWSQCYPTKSKDAQETTSCLRRFLLPSQKPGRIFTNNSQEFISVCQDVRWTHDTTHRSETNGIAERVVR